MSLARVPESSGNVDPTADPVRTQRSHEPEVHGLASPSQQEPPVMSGSHFPPLISEAD